MKLTIHREDEIYRIVDLGKDLELSLETDFSCFLGRSKDCYIYLDSRQISREHLKISLSKGMWLIEDLSKRLPLILNGNQVSQFNPKDGDSIKLGEFSFFLNIKPFESESKKNDDSNVDKIQEEDGDKLDEDIKKVSKSEDLVSQDTGIEEESSTSGKSEDNVIIIK